jgi:hypothetical protein
MMPKVKRDGDFVLIDVPTKDLQSMARFIAHQIVSKFVEIDKVSHKICFGNLDQQDENVEALLELLEFKDWVMVFDAPEALALCDELADVIYEEVGQKFGPVEKQQKENHLRLVKICVDCHKGFVKGESHDCGNK